MALAMKKTVKKARASKKPAAEVAVVEATEDPTPVAKKARASKKPAAEAAVVVATEEPTLVAKKARVSKKPAADANEEATPSVKKARVSKKPAAPQESEEEESEEEEGEEEESEEEAPKKTKAAARSKVIKKPSASSSRDADNDAKMLKKPAAAKPSAAEQAKQAAHDSEAALASRKKELKDMDAAHLKNLVKSKNLEAGVKTANVEAVLAVEAEERQAAAKKVEDVKGVVSKLKVDLKAKGNEELKDLCQARGLKLGGSKEEKVDRLFHHAKEAGDVDRAIADMENEKRKEKLVVMDKASLYTLCNKMGVCPLNKEVMIDRIIAHESRK